MQLQNSARFLRELGFDRTDRVVVVHADDLGMCEATLDAFGDLLEFGLVSSGSAMVPCPWFPAFADWCRLHPGVDAGVHVTLTSEWTGYRWGPLSSRNRATGLLDREGYFHRDRQSLWRNARPSAAAAEMRAQLETALLSGIDVSHIDTHMFTALHPMLVNSYADLAVEYGLPIMVGVDGSGDWIRALGVEPVIAELNARGFPVFDYVSVAGLVRPVSERLAHTKAAFDRLPAGLSCFLLHPAKATAELRAIMPDWQYRVADYEVFGSDSLRRHLRDTGIQVIGYRALRELVRRKAAASG
jgi:predicted glycoside hydrolase/deacetylase ChbG (UPF0249 family)